jgi:FAD/FMN-containing dehydrogenase/Fe-S oxidoreductase
MRLRSEPIVLPTGAVDALARELRQHVRGEVRFDTGSRALYSTDASNYRQVPIGVVIPHDIDDLIETVTVCRRHDAPVLPRGAGTSLAGQSCNAAVVIDISKYLHRILDVDPERRLACVQPGVILDELREAAEAYHLTFGPDPATHDHNTLGGMLGNNSCGVHSVMSGRTAENVEALDVLTYDGVRMRVGATSDAQYEQILREGGRRAEIYRGLRALRDRYAALIRARYPDIPRRVSGYDLTQLLPENGFHVARALVGTEGTCVLILGATLRLVPSPPERVLLVLGYPDVYAAADHVTEVMAARPVGLEGLDQHLVDNLYRKRLHPRYAERLPEGRGWLLVEFGGETRAQAAEAARGLVERLQGRDDAPTFRVLEDPAEQHEVWTIRESGLGATAFVPGKPLTWPGWEDSAVPPERLGEYLRGLRALFDRYDYDGSLYGHFGEGCIHTRVNFALQDEAGIRKWRRFLDEAADLVVRFGGSLSGEHGDGQARAELLTKMYGEELVQAFREFKAIWDPQGRMNPGKVVDPYPITANLRLGARYHPRQLETEFAYTEDDGSFTHATLRCVGVGKCRRLDGGVMCPSYMVTREEMHSTRGRARLLFEMLQGDPIASGWRSPEVREALDLCLACKGCKSDCPVNVDMATYKAEFYSHYYKGRLRPREAYSMGLIYWWCRAAAIAPPLANLVGQTPVLAELAKRVGGIAPQRGLPRFARVTFRDWYRRRPRRASGRPRVLLWPDTFNDHFHPGTAIAAVEVLEAAGFHPVIPRRSLCCARPLYAWGMLDLARHQLGQLLDELEPEIAQATPLVGLEPACVASFRDELVNLFPRDERAQRLAESSFLLGEFLQKESAFEPPPLPVPRRALVHTHCNQHALFGTAEDQALLTALGLDYQMLDSGCCGMAGSFGFEEEHYEVAMAAGERVLLPAVRRADPQTLLITNGYSCREQILQATGRQALHLADLLRMALRGQV